MANESIYSPEEIEKICQEVELQWEYHLLARGAFPINPEGLPEYVSPKFYVKRGVEIKVSFRNPLTPVMQRALAGVHQWLNQNYIIRLYGILDQYKVIQVGKESTEPKGKHIKILYKLRPKVGAHSSGYRNSKDYDARKLTKLIRENYDPYIGDDQGQHYNLAIDTVLYKLKEGYIQFVHLLKGKPKPLPRSTRKNINR